MGVPKSVGKSPKVALKNKLAKQETDNDEELIAKLEEVWSSHCFTGLESRHKMGVLLKKSLGEPAERQDHGRRVMKKAAERLKTSESELSRMRWLGHLFTSVEELRERHPNCRSWTDFKQQLPLMKRGNESAKPQEAKPQKTELERIASSLRTQLNRFIEADPGERRKLYRALVRELSDAAKQGRRKLEELPEKTPNPLPSRQLKVLAADHVE